MEGYAQRELGLRLAHIGINADNEEQAQSWGREFSEIFDFSLREKPTSCYAGEVVEIKKNGGKGTHGHLCFKVNDCQKAIAYFEEKGISFIEGSKKFDSEGKCIFAYMELEIGGFAIHLEQESK